MGELELLFDAPLDLDEEEMERGDPSIIVDEKIRLLLRENRIGLAKGKTERIEGGEGREPGMTYLHVILTCVVHSHPECQFRWARLVVDLGATKGARIQDMVPREVRGNEPVEIKTRMGLGIKFETIEAKKENETSQIVYYPEIVSSGVNFSTGYWDFLAKADGYLHANRDLHLLICVPKDSRPTVRFIVRAKVALSGFLGLIPLLPRTKEIPGTYTF